MYTTARPVLFVAVVAPLIRNECGTEPQRWVRS